MHTKNIDTHHIEEFLLDCNSSGECSEEVARAIIHTINMLALMDPTLNLTIMGQATDSGGGGTLFSLARMLRNLGMPGMAAAYIVGSCSLHNLQTALHNAIIEVFGEGRVDSETI